MKLIGIQLLFSVESTRVNHVQIVEENHICPKSLNLEVKMKNLTEKLNRSKQICADKSKQIKKLNSLLGYYQKRSKSLKEIISNMKNQELISEQTELILNVSHHTLSRSHIS